MIVLSYYSSYLEVFLLLSGFWLLQSWASAKHYQWWFLYRPHGYCNPIRCHTTTQVSRSCNSMQFQPLRQKCSTCYNAHITSTKLFLNHYKLRLEDLSNTKRVVDIVLLPVVTNEVSWDNIVLRFITKDSLYLSFRFLPVCIFVYSLIQSN